MDNYLPSRLAEFLQHTASATTIITETATVSASVSSSSTPTPSVQPTLGESLLTMKPLLPTYLHLVVSALLPIYAGAHASLSRPSSAAKPPQRPDPLDEDQDEATQPMESLTTSDALAFPLIAAATLTGLYFLITWLQDPALLNTLLNLYFSSFSVFAIARLVSDALDLAHSLAFPRVYRDRGLLFRVDATRRRAELLSGEASVASPTRTNPLPGPLSRLTLPPGIHQILWFLKTAPPRKFTVHLHAHPLHLRAPLKIHQIEGLLVGLCTVLYYNLISRPWPLTNLMGFSFAYGALQLLSLGTFATGSLLLAALFVYDIYMVFYTPMMVTVAKGLDIPAKLVFPRPGKGELAMLGLGDVVLPGVMVALALRFDLWAAYYHRRQSRPPVDGQPGARAEYRKVTGHWGTKFWTSPLLYPLTGFPHTLASTTANTTPSPSFPKRYFSAALGGYTLGLLTTLVAMVLSDHPQPALLYLVPGVVGALWLTAVIRGEVNLLWGYSEIEEQDTDEKQKKKKREGEISDAKAKDEPAHEEKKERGEALLGYFGLPTRSETGGEDGEDGGGEKKKKEPRFGLWLELPPSLSVSSSEGEGAESRKGK